MRLADMLLIIHTAKNCFFESAIVVVLDEIGRASLARENEAGAVGGRRSIYSILTYRSLFCFGRNNRTVPK